MNAADVTSVSDYQQKQRTKTLHTLLHKNSHTAPDAENALHCSTHIPGTSVRSILGNAVKYIMDIFS